MTTIVLIVSRAEYLTKVLSSLELLACNQNETNLLIIVDGDDALFIKTRNLSLDLKFATCLVVPSDLPGKPTRYSIPERRKRIVAHHNQARQLIQHDKGFVFSVEDDTTFPPNALHLLTTVALNNRAYGLTQGVELGRWGVPYVGAWKADDIYDPKLIISVDNKYSPTQELMSENIDAGGLYCTLVRADLYKMHEFTCDNGLGPDINLGLALRQQGFENFIVWNVPCTHHYSEMGVEKTLTPEADDKKVTLVKESDTEWRVLS